MNGFKVMVSWEGIEDTYTEEYDGVVYASRDQARRVLIEAKKNDIEGNVYFIKEETT